MSEPVVFVSYSQQDEAEKQTLLTHLGVLATAGLVGAWHDGDIAPGADRRAAGEDALTRARVAILLVTANFLSSRPLMEGEVAALLRRREREGLTVIPVIARACAWEQVPWLAAMQVRPRNGRPVWGDGGAHIDEELAALAGEVAGLVGERPLEADRPERAPPLPPLPDDPVTATLADLPPVALLPPGSHLVFNPNPFFTGRVRELLAVARVLLYEPPPTLLSPLAIVHGLGGVGKTQLAVEFAFRYGRFFSGGVYWVDFSEPAAIDSNVALCGRPMGLIGERDNAPLDEQVRRVRNSWATAARRLLIFDNCDSDAARELVETWRPPPGSGGRVLVTSRRGAWPRALGAAVLPLGGLDHEDSIALLRRHCDDASLNDLDALAAEVGDLPLALHLVGSFLEAYAGTSAGAPPALLERLRDPALLARERNVLTGWEATATPTGHELSVACTFALSYDRLDDEDERDKLAMALLARAAHFAPGEPIPWALLAATMRREGVATDELDAADAARRLMALGLLKAANEGRWLLHRLLAHFVLVRATDGTALEDVEHRLLDEANRLEAAGYPAQLRAWQPHLRHATDRALARRDTQAADLCLALADHLAAIADYTGARPYYEQALAIRQEILGERHPDTATTLNNLGYLFRVMGDLAGAQTYLEAALALRTKVLGESHPDTATTLYHLGTLLYVKGDLSGARSYHEAALAIQEEALGRHHPDTAASLDNMGSVLQAMEDIAGARPYYEAALAIRKEVLGERHPDTATSLNNVGYLLQTMGDLAGARPYFEEALAIDKETLGERHPDTAVDLNNLGGLLYLMGDLAGARPFLEEALLIRRDALGSHHHDTAQSLNNLGRLTSALGDPAGARPYYEEALTILDVTLGPDHTFTKLTRGNLESLGDTTR